METNGKPAGKQCYICDKPATTVHYDRPMCLQCVVRAVKYAEFVKKSIRKEEAL